MGRQLAVSGPHLVYPAGQEFGETHESMGRWGQLVRVIGRGRVGGLPVLEECNPQPRFQGGPGGRAASGAFGLVRYQVIESRWEETHRLKEGRSQMGQSIDRELGSNPGAGVPFPRKRVVRVSFPE